MANVNGTSGNDSLVGTAGDDSIDALDGQDFLYGGPGQDTLQGGPGADTLRGAEGNDTLFTRGDGDVLYGGDGDDHLSLEGNGGSTIFNGAATIYGGAGNDSIGGHQFSNTVVVGGPGDDTIGFMTFGHKVLLGPGSGHDTIDNFGPGTVSLYFHATRFTSFAEIQAAAYEDGRDVVIPIEATTSVRLTYTDKTQLDHNARLFFFDPTPLPAVLEGPTPVLTQSGKIDGTAGDDTLLGNASTDTISGFAGNDFIDGGRGSDLVSTGDGDDTVVIGLGYGTVGLSGGGTGNDTVRVNAPLEDVAWVRDEGTLRVLRLTDDTTLTQDRSTGDSFKALEALDHAPATFDRPDSDGADVRAGGVTADRLEGGAGDDILYGNGGADTLVGGTGDDYLGTGLDDANDDWFDGGEGADTLSYSGATNGGVSLWMGAGVAMGDGIGSDRFVDFEAVIGSAGADVLVGRDGVGDNLRGYWGDDWLYGFSLDDVLAGGEGQDVLVGGEDDDTLDGGGGDDWLHAGSGTNQVRGGAGTDVLISQGSNDVLAGGAGDDYVYGYGSGITVAAGDAGNDVFVMDGQSTVDGGHGHDYFYMSAASDVMIGGTGNDVLFGGGGYDLFDGGAGVDYLFMGTADCVAVFRSDSGADVIHGFKAEGTHHGIRFEDTPLRSFADILAATYDFNGDALIRIDEATVVWLVGVSKSQLTARDFAIL